MLDVHTHILPEMDDGSRSVDQSIRMLRCEAEQGVDAVILTPHFYAHKESLEKFLARRAAASEKLEQRLRGVDGVPGRVLGAEAAYFHGMSRVEELDALCIGNSRVMLIEMPFGRWDRHMLDELVALKEERGIRPVLAHVERYMRWQPPKLYKELREEGIWFQANTSFFLNWQRRWLAVRMLEKRMLQFIGSDCHGMKQRAPDMKPAMELIGNRCGKRTLKYLVNMEKRILES